MTKSCFTVTHPTLEKRKELLEARVDYLQLLRLGNIIFHPTELNQEIQRLEDKITQLENKLNE